MKKGHILLLLLVFFVSDFFSQTRAVNKLTLEKTYTYSQIAKTLRDTIDKNPKTSYFNDDFFNRYLKRVVSNKKYSEKQKAQLFYLMQKRVGYAFFGADYVPPKQSYFTHHSGKTFILDATKKSLVALKYNIKGLMQIVDSNYKKDGLLAGNALLLASLLNSEAILKKLENYTKAEVILTAKNPDIFNHYACMAASVAQNTVIAANLGNNLFVFKKECMLEDVFCAIYSHDNFVTIMKKYILAEKNPENDLSIETALCALAAKVPRASVEKSIQSLIDEAQEHWKIDLCRQLLFGKIPFGYALSSEDQLMTKLWEGVNETVYTDGRIILNGSLMEFDPN